MLDQRLVEQVNQIAQEATQGLNNLLALARRSRKPGVTCAPCAGRIRQLQGELERIAADFEQLAAGGPDADIAL